MANLKDCPKFANHDDYYTNKSAWETINHLIPKDKIVWESCMLGSVLSRSPHYLTELGNQVVYDTKMDMLRQQPAEWDMIVTNIPFDKKIKLPILKRMTELDKPFVIILNSMNTFTNYLREIFAGKMQHLQIVTPRGKVKFHKCVGGEIKKTGDPSFYCVYLCYKMNLSNEQQWTC